FHSLEKKHMKDIVSLMIKEVQNRMETQEMSFTITDGAIEKIAEEGFDPEYGARPLRRSIQTNIEDLLSEELLKGTMEKGVKVRIGLNSKGEFSILKKIMNSRKASDLILAFLFLIIIRWLL